MMKFTVVEASSPYNIILGRTGMRELCAVSSTTHAMMKFPTPRGITTLVPRKDAIFECRQIEGGMKVSPGEAPEEKTGEKKEESPTEDVVINPAFPDQRDFGPGKKQGSDERGGGMAQSGDSEANAIPYVDIKSGAGKEDRSEDRGRDGILIQMFFRRIQRVSPNPNVQRGRGKTANLEALDDMVIKSRTEKDMIMDVMETFDNVRKVNMKLNPKKCSFGVKEGKFLGYMVTSERI
ncbi:hypothetical protein Tco_1487062 [Tanacetum coccineum]